MVAEVIMPKLGLTMNEGTIIEWLKQEGDPVKTGERLLWRDGRRWTVLDAKRAVIAEGRLDEKVPGLSPGQNRIAIACSVGDRASIKLVKVYE